MHKREKLLEDSARVFSVQAHELPRTSERFFTEWKELRKRLESTKESVAKAKASELFSRKGKELKAYFEGADPKTLIETGNSLIGKRPEVTAVMGSGNSIVVMCGPKSGKKAGAELKALLGKFGGKGGGSDRMAAGKIEKTAEFREFLRK